MSLRQALQLNPSSKIHSCSLWTQQQLSLWTLTLCWFVLDIEICWWWKLLSQTDDIQIIVRLWEPPSETSSHLCLICIKIWKETIVAICVLLFFLIGSFLEMKWKRREVKNLQQQEYEIFGHVLQILIFSLSFLCFLFCNEVIKRGFGGSIAVAWIW